MKESQKFKTVCSDPEFLIQAPLTKLQEWVDRLKINGATHYLITPSETGNTISGYCLMNKDEAINRRINELRKELAELEKEVTEVPNHIKGRQPNTDGLKVSEEVTHD